MQTITYGEFTIDPANLPEASVQALLSRGVTHYLGNEQASKLTNLIRKAVNAEAPSAVTSEQVKTYREANAETVSGWNNELVASALAALTAGTVGVRAAAGPKLDPIAKIAGRIAKAEVLSVLKSQSIAAPKGDEKVRFADGTELSMADLVSRRLAKHGERINTEAKAESKRVERENAKRAANAGADLADLIG